MSAPTEGPSQPAPSPLVRPFAENAFRLLELEIEATPGEAAKVAGKLAARVRSGKDDPSGMLGLGPLARTPEAVEAAGKELQEPARAALHALFFPWVGALPYDPTAVARGLAALTEQLRSATSPVALVRPLARRVLPAPAPRQGEAAPVEVGGYLFPGDIELGEALGPPVLPEGVAPEGLEETGFLAALSRAPAALSDAVLAATRLGAGRRLHASYLRSLLAACDGGDPSAWRRLPTADKLFEEVQDEPGAPLILAWREFVLGHAEEAKEALLAAEEDAGLTEAERQRARVLRVRLTGAEEPEAALAALEGLEGPEARAARGAILLHKGEVEAATPELEAAFASEELRPRLAPLWATCLVERGDLDAAQVALAEAAPGRNAALARARLAHARGMGEGAVDAYREALEDEEDGPLGAWWGLAVLSTDREEREAARAWLEGEVDGTELAATIALQALRDGQPDELEAWLDRLGDDDEATRVAVQLLDRLGRRSEAWKLRDEAEDPVRDRARALLEQGRAEEAFADLAGLPVADPLRRRAARAAVLRALARADQAELEPEAVVERVLGRLSPEEQALLDLPAHLYRAVREIERGSTVTAISALRRHLDSGDDALASRLFEVLNAPSAEGWGRLATFLGAVGGKGSLEELVEGAQADDALWEAAVICAAAQGLSADPGRFDGGSAELQQAAGLLSARRALLRGDWAGCEAGLRRYDEAHPEASLACKQALGAVALARFPEARRSDPEAALRALEAVPEPSREVLHDRALWRHYLAAQAPMRTGSMLGGVFSAWDKARQARALVHPAHLVEQRQVEDELMAVLVQLLNAVPPAAALDVRVGIEASGTALGREVLERAGWVEPSRPPRAGQA